MKELLKMCMLPCAPNRLSSPFGSSKINSQGQPVHPKTVQERRYTMRKSLACICALIMAFMIVLCQTSPKATAETGKPGKSLAPNSFNLNGKWKVTSKWKSGYASGTFNFQYEIVQKGMKITMINTRSGSYFPGTLKGNIMHLEPRDAYNPSNSVTSYLPAREYKISQDGNTLTSGFDYTWRREGDEQKRKKPGSMTVIMIRE